MHFPSSLFVRIPFCGFNSWFMNLTIFFPQFVEPSSKPWLIDKRAEPQRDTGESIGVLISYFTTAHAHCPVKGVEVTFTSGFELS